jgi:hypothetical protein
MDKDTSKAKFFIPSLVPPALLGEGSSGIIARELWWTNQELIPVNIIPPTFTMLIYHLGDEKYARCW